MAARYGLQILNRSSSTRRSNQVARGGDADLGSALVGHPSEVRERAALATTIRSRATVSAANPIAIVLRARIREPFAWRGSPAQAIR